MTALGLVIIDGRERTARGAPSMLPAGAFLQLSDGQVVRVESDGHLEQLVRGGAPWGRSIAADPAVSRGYR